MMVGQDSPLVFRLEIMSEFEIQKTLVASTFHTSYDDMTLLETLAECNTSPESVPFWVESYEFGILISLFGNFEFGKIGELPLSDGFLELLIFCVSLDCSALKLDIDGPTYDGFKKYDW